MAISVPIVSEWNPKGLERAVADFKKLEGAGAKANFAIKKAAVPAGIAVAALGGFLVNAAKGAEEARQANQRLGNVLESMGFGEATDRVSAYAESLEKTIAVDADVIKATQTKLATFGQLTKTVNEAGGAFDRATLAALDMAAAGFGSAESNAVALGKALEDPIKGITALAKSGVTFTEQEKEKIKTLVESNKMLEAQDMVLSAIEKQVGGTSEASASSFDKMKFALAGISDTFGELVLPYIDRFAVALTSASKFVQENEKLVGILVLTFGGFAAAILLVNAAMKVYQAVQLITTVATAAFNAVLYANPITLIIIAIVALVAALVLAYKRFESVRKVVDTVFEFVTKAVKGSVDVIKSYFETVFGVYKSIFNGIAKLWNNTIGKLSFSVPDWVPVIGGKGFSVPNIPMLAEGGIVNSPTLAMIGERGPEAVVPLDRYRGGGGGNYTINVNGGLSSSAEIGQAVVNSIRAFNRTNGPASIQVA
jgi:phage-related protein